jgi:hypothetical protein
MQGRQLEGKGFVSFEHTFFVLADESSGVN